MKIVLFLKNVNPDSCFHYGRKQGGDLKFVYNREKDRHEVTFPIEEWRQDNYYIARMFLDGPLVVPVFFDIEEDEQTEILKPQASSFKPETKPAKPSGRKSKLTPEQRAAAQADYEEQSAILTPKPEIEAPPSFIPT